MSTQCPFEKVVVVERSFLEEVQQNMTKVRGSAVGLDSLAGSFFINEKAIAVVGNVYNLEHFGGFEYIDRGSVVSVGNITFYHHEAPRVQRCIDIWLSSRAK